MFCWQRAISPIPVVLGEDSANFLSISSQSAVYYCGLPLFLEPGHRESSSLQLQVPVKATLLLFFFSFSDNNRGWSSTIVSTSAYRESDKSVSGRNQSSCLIRQVPTLILISSSTILFSTLFKQLNMHMMKFIKMVGNELRQYEVMVQNLLSSMSSIFFVL